MLELSDETIATAVLMAGACRPTPFWPKAEITSAPVPTIPIQQPFICSYSFAFVSEPNCFLLTRALQPSGRFQPLERNHDAKTTCGINVLICWKQAHWEEVLRRR